MHKPLYPPALDRRSLLRLGGLLVTGSAIGLAMASCSSDDSAAGATPSSPAGSATAELSEPAVRTADEALERLKAGNARFVSGRLRHPNLTAAHRTVVAAGQQPFAQILTCADSRVSPELLFDQGLGDLFVDRSAGHVLDRAVLGSIEYGVLELNIPLIVVLGHERCGAVKATVESVEKHSAPSGTDIDALVAAIKPAVEQAKTRGGDLLDESVRAHVANVVAALKTKPVIGPAIAAGKLQVVGGRYDLDTGQVDLIVPATPA